MEKITLNSLIDRGTKNLTMQKNGGKIESQNSSPFDFLYLFSNENLGYLFSMLDVRGKDILTLGSSGDQVLYAHAGGANIIVQFDINPFSKMYLEYKMEAIKELDYRDFKKFFNGRKYPALSIELYSKIRPNLNDETKAFWDEMYRQGLGRGKVHMHKDDSGTPYSKADYLKIRKALLDHKPNVRFINADVRQIMDSLDKCDKFDYILLSNVFNYIGDRKSSKSPKETFIDIVRNLETHLNPSGSMQIGYMWEDVVSHSAVFGMELGLRNVSTIVDPVLREGSIMYTPPVKKINNTISSSKGSL